MLSNSSHVALSLAGKEGISSSWTNLRQGCHAAAALVTGQIAPLPASS